MNEFKPLCNSRSAKLPSYLKHMWHEDGWALTFLLHLVRQVHLAPRSLTWFKPHIVGIPCIEPPTERVKKWNNIPFWNDLCAQNWLDKIIAHDTEKPKDKPIPEKFTAREKKSRPASSFPRSAFSTSISSSKRKSTGLQRLMLVINYLSYRIIFIDFFFSTDRLSPRICMLRGFIGCGVGWK